MEVNEGNKMTDSRQEYIGASPLEGIEVTINSPSELRRALLDCIAATIEGRLDVARLNAIVGASAELHKSIKQQWDMKIYAAEHLAMYGELPPLIEGNVDE